MVPWLMDVQAAQNSIPKHGGSSQSGTLPTCYHTIHVINGVFGTLTGIRPVSDPGVTF